MTTPTENPFARLTELQVKLNCDWKSINKAQRATDAMIKELQAKLLPGPERPISEDVGLVFFGSLARHEWTSKSDADWVLLIDGEANQQHFTAAREIARGLDSLGLKAPGNAGTFGDLAFSHDLVHRIGGADDTNRNLTLRMLLLLESLSIGSDIVKQRVVRSILVRYLADDRSWTARSDAELPRFLLNDVIRYWRTMAVDFADKFHDQEGEKWALRNTKLRFSRKLIFLTGLLACFSWKLHRPADLGGGSESAIDIAIAHFTRYLSRPPLEIIADELLLTEAGADISRNLLSSYDGFLAILDEDQKRKALEALPRGTAENNFLFGYIRDISDVFQSAILSWLFRPETRIQYLVQKYGIF